MWTLLNFQGFLFPFQDQLDALIFARLAKELNELVLLGLIPGTDISITFSWFVMLAWCVFFSWLLLKAYPEAIHIVRENKLLIKKQTDIELRSL